MVGKGVLLECLESNKVESVLIINRSSCGISHAKLKEIIQKDFFALSEFGDKLSGYNTCFFCMGISSAGISEIEYERVTYQLTISVARTLFTKNPEIIFCYVSGAGTSTSGKSSMNWARVKGQTENELLAMPFKKAFMFRPGYIQPLKGIKSGTALYNLAYFFSSPFYFILKSFKGVVTDTVTLGNAMINAVAEGYPKNILESSDINILGSMK